MSIARENVCFWAGQNSQCQFYGASAFHCRYNSYEASNVKEYSTIDITPMEQMDCKCIPL